MVTYRAPFSHWADFSFEDLAAFTFDWLAEPSNALALSADIVLAPVTDNSPRQNHIITPQLITLANQLAYVTDLNYKMGLLKRIEFATGSDLDNIWGRVYELKRRYGETDDQYRKRLQVYLLQVAGSGTKAAIEEIISIICEWPNCCRVDTYWPGYCRIYITNAYARQKARDRLALIDLVLPNTVAAGVDYRFYIPYVDLTADMLMHGPVYNNLAASILLRDKVETTFEASVFMAARSSVTLDADIVVGSVTHTALRASEAIQDETTVELDADIALSGREDLPLTANEALQGDVETTFRAYARMVSDIQTPVEADMLLQANRLRPVEARIMLEAA